LEGGMNNWQKNNRPTSTELPNRTVSDYKIKQTLNIASDMTDIKMLVQKQHLATLLDTRDYERYAGIVEPKYLKSGHIPDAVNYETKDVLEADGKLKSQKSLNKHFSGLDKQEKIIVSCGSGNSAAVSYVALKAAGYEDVSLYAGGFSEWIADDENEVEK